MPRIARLAAVLLLAAPLASLAVDSPSEAPELLREAALAARTAARRLTLGITAPTVSNPPPEPPTTTTEA